MENKLHQLKRSDQQIESILNQLLPPSSAYWSDLTFFRDIMLRLIPNKSKI